MKTTIIIPSSKRFTIVFALVLIAGWFSLAPSPALAAPDSPACSVSPESRQLDFWLGDWTVTYPGMAGSSASKVSLDLDKCLVIETWQGAKGHTGKNIFAYSADDQRWHGMFADNEGRVHVFEGKVSAGLAEFTGPSRGAEGQTVLNRIKVVQVAADKVEQSWEKSTDNGATWTTVFHGQYSRKASEVNSACKKAEADSCNRKPSIFHKLLTKCSIGVPYMALSLPNSPSKPHKIN